MIICLAINPPIRSVHVRPALRHDKRGGSVRPSLLGAVILFRSVIRCHRLPLRRAAFACRACFSLVLPFCVRTPWYSAASVAPPSSSHRRLSSCLLATPINLGAHLDGLALRRLIVPIGPVACPCGRLVLSFAPPHRHGERGERRGGLVPRAWCDHPVCLPLRLRRDLGRRLFHSVPCRFRLFGLLARHLTIAGQYLDGQCGSSSGRVSVGFDYFPAYFVFPAALYPFARFPPRRPVPSHPCPVSSHPFRYLLASPSSSYALANYPSWCSLRLSAPTAYRPSPRLSCRVSGADFLKASNSMPLKSWLWNDASLPLSCLPSDGFHAARRLISSSHRIHLALTAYRRPAQSRYRLTNGVAPASRPAHRVGERGGGCAWMSSGAMRSIPVIYDSRWRSPHRACLLLPIISSISSSHPLSFLAPPPLPGYFSVCLL